MLNHEGTLNMNRRSIITAAAYVYCFFAPHVLAEIRPDGRFEDGVVSVVYRQGDGNVSIVGDGSLITAFELVSTADDFFPPQPGYCDHLWCIGTETKVFELQPEGALSIDLGPRAHAHLNPDEIAQRWTVTGATTTDEIDSTQAGGSSVDLLVIQTDLIGDFSSNKRLDADDMDILSRQTRNSVANPNFDLNGDSAVSQADREFWLHDLAKSWYGDANLDGRFDTADFLQVFAAAEYNDLPANNSTWATGDWNGDGDFGTGDLIVAFQDGGYETDPVGAGRALNHLPETTSPGVTAIVAFWLLSKSRRRLR